MNGMNVPDDPYIVRLSGAASTINNTTTRNNNNNSSRTLLSNNKAKKKAKRLSLSNRTWQMLRWKGVDSDQDEEDERDNADDESHDTLQRRRNNGNRRRISSTVTTSSSSNAAAYEKCCFCLTLRSASLIISILYGTLSILGLTGLICSINKSSTYVYDERNSKFVILNPLSSDTDHGRLFINELDDDSNQSSFKMRLVVIVLLTSQLVANITLIRAVVRNSAHLIIPWLFINSLFLLLFIIGIVMTLLVGYVQLDLNYTQFSYVLCGSALLTTIHFFCGIVVYQYRKMINMNLLLNDSNSSSNASGQHHPDGSSDQGRYNTNRFETSNENNGYSRPTNQSNNGHGVPQISSNVQHKMSPPPSYNEIHKSYTLATSGTCGQQQRQASAQKATMMPPPPTYTERDIVSSVQQLPDSIQRYNQLQMMRHATAGVIPTAPPLPPIDL